MIDYERHPEYQGLLHDILLDPDDDVPRLVLADWLDDGPDPLRAEFIRLQVEHDALERGLTPEKRRALRRRSPRVRRCQELQEQIDFASHFRDWPVGMIVPASRLSFRRGFVWAVHCEMSVFLAHAGTAFRTDPIDRISLAQKHPRPCGGLINGQRRVRWCWELLIDDEEERARRVAVPLFSRLNPPLQFGQLAYYERLKDAVDDLSLACVRYGRSLVPFLAGTTV